MESQKNRKSAMTYDMIAFGLFASVIIMWWLYLDL